MNTCGYQTYDKDISSLLSITLLGLSAILKRLSFKDAVFFKEHNEEYEFNSDLFLTALYFNLQSEYGVGKKLEPIIKDLLVDEFDIEKYKDDLFYREIVKLSPELSNLIRQDSDYQILNWEADYSLNNLNATNELSTERFERLLKLFDITDFKNDNNSCPCNFCREFLKFHTLEKKSANEIILSILKDIKLNKNE